jgi:hypothetical protein
MFKKDAQDRLKNTLMKMTNSKLKRLDKVLLKGFYTHDRVELENPCLLKESKKQKKTNPQE